MWEEFAISISKQALGHELRTMGISQALDPAAPSRAEARGHRQNEFAARLAQSKR